MLAGERQEPASNNSHGLGGGGRLHRLLDSDPRLCNHQGSDQHPQLHATDYLLAFLHRPGLHQQVTYIFLIFEDSRFNDLT